MLALVPVATSWLQRAVATPSHGWFEGSTTFEVGADFWVFYTAGDLARSGRFDTLYEVEDFRSEIKASTDREPGPASFGHPPVLAILLAPLSFLDPHAAWVLWTIASIALLLGALFLLAIPRPFLTAALILLTYPGYLAVISGQLSMLWLVVVAGVFRAIQSRSEVIAGLIAGVLVLKPPLLLGFLIWWTIDPRTRRALPAAVLSGSVIIGISALFALHAWFEYPGAARTFAESHANPQSQWAQFSPWGFVSSLTTSISAVGLTVGALASLMAVAVYWWIARAHRHDRILLYAACVTLTLWISPHVIAYDWLLMVSVVAAMWHRGGTSTARLAFVSAGLACIALWTIVLGSLTLDRFGWSLQLAVIAFAVSAFVLFARPDDHHPTAQAGGDDHLQVVIDLRGQVGLDPAHEERATRNRSSAPLGGP